MEHPLRKYEKTVKKDKQEFIDILDVEMKELWILERQIAKNNKLAIELRNRIMRNIDDRKKDIYYERKLLTGRF